jgi:uncharacterized protein (TIGR02118 family)
LAQYYHKTSPKTNFIYFTNNTLMKVLEQLSFNQDMPVVGIISGKEPKMHKLVILIETAGNQAEFEKTWPVFLAAAERMPGLRREASSHIEHVLVGDLPYNLVHELFFDSMQDTQAAMASPEGRSAGKLLQAMTDGKLAMFFADHREDSLENIQKSRKPRQDE